LYDSSAETIVGFSSSDWRISLLPESPRSGDYQLINIGAVKFGIGGFMECRSRIHTYTEAKQPLFRLSPVEVRSA
jgi:hypothetical protein